MTMRNPTRTDAKAAMPACNHSAPNSFIDLHHWCRSWSSVETFEPDAWESDADGLGKFSSRGTPRYVAPLSCGWRLSISTSSVMTLNQRSWRNRRPALLRSRRWFTSWNGGVRVERSRMASCHGVGFHGPLRGCPRRCRRSHCGRAVMYVCG